MRLKIQKSGEKDLPFILELHRELESGQAGRGFSLAKARRIFAKMRDYPDYGLYVARIGKEVIGTFALLMMDNLAHDGARSAIVEDVVVSPRFQGMGIGKAMMDHAMELARKKQCYKLVLSSNLSRKKAHAFYRSLGFRQHGLSFFVKLP